MQNNKETFVYNSLLKILDTAEVLIHKAQSHVSEGKCTESDIINAKLADDMYPFVKQIQVLTDNVKGSISRLAGVEIPKYEDNETTLAELLSRVEKTRSFIKTINPNDIGKIKNNEDGVDNMTIKLPWMPEGMSWTGAQYINGFVLQNAYFHLVVAYSIIRMKGVNIGKMNFIGNI